MPSTFIVQVFKDKLGPEFSKITYKMACGPGGNIDLKSYQLDEHEKKSKNPQPKLSISSVDNESNHL